MSCSVAKGSEVAGLPGGGSLSQIVWWTSGAAQALQVGREVTGMLRLMSACCFEVGRGSRARGCFRPPEWEQLLLQPAVTSVLQPQEGECANNLSEQHWVLRG